MCHFSSFYVALIVCSENDVQGQRRHQLSTCPVTLVRNSLNRRVTSLLQRSDTPMTVGQDPLSDVLHLSLKFNEIKHPCFHTKDDVWDKKINKSLRKAT